MILAQHSFNAKGIESLPFRRRSSSFESFTPADDEESSFTSDCLLPSIVSTPNLSFFCGDDDTSLIARLALIDDAAGRSLSSLQFDRRLFIIVEFNVLFAASGDK